MDYLRDYQNNYFTIQQNFLSADSYKTPLNFDDINVNIRKFQETLSYNAYKELKEGTIANAKIINIKEYGLLCEIDESSQIGLVHVSDITDQNFLDNETYVVGQLFKVKIKAFKPKIGKYKLSIVQD